MKILFIGGIFDDSHNDEIISKTRTYVEYAANNFQKKIIQGFKANDINLDVVSAPFIGAYPQAYSDIFFKGFQKQDNSEIKYVKFNNIWGIRNFSRYKAIKNELKSFVKLKDKDKLILVYTPHTPFLEAAVSAKRKDKNIKICLIVPDLPEYMNLGKNISNIYKFFKKYDIKEFNRACRFVDTFVLLTEQMKYKLNVCNKKYCVVEGISEGTRELNEKNNESKIKTIVYTGKLNESFGIIHLIQAFSNITDPNLRLVICGSGEEESTVRKYALNDSRINFLGQVSSDFARKIIKEGDVLVNPRQNNTEYTKYSFPSKIIDYLSTGNPVIAYKLDGFPDIYDNFIHYVEDDSIEALSTKIIEVLKTNSEKNRNMSDLALDYLKNNLSKEIIASKILKLNFDK